MPVRKILKNYRNVTGVAPSRKSVGEAQFESTLERDFLALLDFSPLAIRYEVQPVKIEWRDELGKTRNYTPDVLVEFDPSFSTVPWLCEVKYRADIKKNWQELHPKFRRGIRYAKAHNWRFRIISDLEIRTPYLTNVRFLSPFRYRPIPQQMIDELLVRLLPSTNTTPTALTASFSQDPWKQAEWLPVLWHLVAQGRVGADLSVELNMDSPLWSES